MGVVREQSQLREIGCEVVRVRVTRPPGPGGRWMKRPPTLAFTRYCQYQYSMVYGIQTEGRGRVMCCAIVLQSYYDRIGNAGGRGNNRKVV